MEKLSAKIRDKKEDVKSLRSEGLVPAILYGPKVKTLSLKLNRKDLEIIYGKAGESSLISLEVDGKGYQVLIYDFQKDPLTDNFLHVDFFQPSLTEKVEASIPLVFKGESPAVKDLDGTLVKNIKELDIKAFPQELPHEIEVDISSIKSFEDHIKISDLKLPGKVEVQKDPEEIIASVVPPRKVEEELEKPIEEKVEEVEKVEEKEEQEGEKKEDIEES